MDRLGAGVRRVGRAPRRVTVGLVAGGSILGSRSFGDLLTSAADVVDLGINSIILYQSYVSDGVVSAYLTWFFVGYSIYALLPEVPGRLFGDFRNARSFRALTAVIAIYVGVLLGRLTGGVPSAGIFGLIPDDMGLVVPLVGGLLVGVGAFSAVVRSRGETLLSEESQHFAAMEEFAVESQRDSFEKLERLPDRHRRLVVAINESTVGAIYALFGMMLGIMVGPAVNLLSPLPEVIVVGGVLISRLPWTGRVRQRLPRWAGGDLDLHVAALVSRTLQNFKGAVLLLFIFLGFVIAGIAFVAGIGVVFNAAGQLRDLVLAGRVTGASLSAWAEIGVTIWFVVGLVQALLVFGIFGVAYWVQQLRRLPPYVTYWEARWAGEEPNVPPSSVTRPPGLFLPGAATLLLPIILLWLTGETVPSLPSMVAYGLTWPLVFVVVCWSLSATIRREAQPLANEDRSVTVALLVQAGAGVVAGGIADAFPHPVLIVGLIALVVFATYWPDVGVYAEQHHGWRAFSDIGYTIGLFGLLLGCLAIYAWVPPAIVGLIVVLMVVLAYLRYLEVTAEAE